MNWSLKVVLFCIIPKFLLAYVSLVKHVITINQELLCAPVTSDYKLTVKLIFTHPSAYD